MRRLHLALLLLAGHAAAASPSLPDWATPGAESRSVRDALDALHAEGFPVDVIGGLAVVPAYHGPLAGTWMFIGGTADGPPTRYYRFETPRGGTEATIVSSVCEDTPDVCLEHEAAIHRLSPAPPPPPPEPPSPDGKVRGWTTGAGGVMPQRMFDRDITCIVCSPPAYPVGVVLTAPPRPALLRITVDDMANVLDVRIQESTGNRALDRAALTQAWTWSFQPGQRGVHAVGGDVLVPINFSSP